MSFRPIDIQKKTFNKVFRGFDEVEVESYLEEVACYCTELLKENSDLRDKMREKEIRINELIEREKTVNTTLSVVRKLSDEMKDNAKKQSETIIGEAKNKAKDIFVRLKDEVRVLKGDINTLERKKQEIKKSLIHYLKGQMTIIEGFGEIGDQPKSECMSSKFTKENRC